LVPKRPTIAEIAQRAGVSTGAVSYALNGLPGVSEATRSRILKIADEIGWRPNLSARAASMQRARTVALILARPGRSLGVGGFFLQFIEGVEQTLSERGAALLLQVVPDHETAVDVTRRWWTERRIDGVLITDVHAGDTRLPVIEEMGIPAVIVGRPQPDCALPSVWSDDATSVTEVVDYLYALGHRRIARVSGKAELDHTRVRDMAFLAAIRRHGLDAGSIHSADYSGEEGARITRRLLTGPDRPTAITYDNDLMAVAALGVARELNITVPDQLSLVAGEDSELCLLTHPSLTALSRDVTGYGADAAKTLLEVIEGTGSYTPHDQRAHLIPRSSTGQAPPPEVTGG
jgi:DNA-binding LacI/PurR family transcriptional regulator